MPRILLLDNYDSFVYNLYQLLSALGASTDVVRNDVADRDSLSEYDGVVISPGPGDPRDPKRTGIGPEILADGVFDGPVLGVCLGHQEIVSAFGGKIRPAKTLIHGKQSRIRHFEDPVFEGVPKLFRGGRYHSLVGDLATLPDVLKPLAVSVDDGELMAVRHRRLPVIGVQFHPESVLTPQGPKIIRNFLGECVR
ncbi:MAG: aminodeoxychorismate/anthranilate synthase component II [Thermoprotei archaeon]